MKTNGFIVAAALAALALSGCAQTESQQRAGTGALIGGAGGALVGQAIGRDTKSTVIGAASGALLGAVIGSSTAPKSRDDERMCRYRDYNSGRVFVAPCDDRYYNGQY
ncbi:YMGG-like glycine zipper-containing protein [Mesorhizobium sp. CN5-321]|jgi:outer membrane lipoprotein SlyB|uniref:YMGG-like glycine zipper-containing protein n=1 Tax=Mesorhizobium hunchu TaxID=3157708 RepID=UPI0032B70D91